MSRHQPSAAAAARRKDPLAPPGRYRATIGKMMGDVVTPIGEPQAFQVMPLPR